MHRYAYSNEARAALEGLQQPLAVYQLIDDHVTTLILSDGFCRLFGYPDRAQAVWAMDHDMYRNTHPDDRERIVDAAERFATSGDDGKYEVLYRTRAGVESDYRVIHAHGRHIRTETGIRLAQVWFMDEGLYIEGDESSGTRMNLELNSVLHEESILRAANYDALTGLPNLAYFFKLCEADKARVLGEGGQECLLYIDLNGMKYYNHRNGYAEGDKLLKAFGQKLADAFGHENCCHVGADRFAVSTTEDALENRLKRFFSEVEGMEHHLPVRVGIYAFSIEDVPASAAYDRAKVACDIIPKTENSSFHYYSRALSDTEKRRRYIQSNIDRAISEKWITVYYQPIVRAVNGKVCDEEALARWIDPEMGFLSPAEFIPELEASGQIYKLDLYVLEQVLQKLKKQTDAGLYLVPQSINLSRMDFDSCDIVEEIRRRVDGAGIRRDLITIEITESVVGTDFEFMKAQVGRFQELGFQVWMDDFGSGYSSLDVLQSIHFDVIKLDMHFMQQFDQGDEGKIILTELVKMAIGLGVETVCEGVEEEPQVEFLREIGCTKIQGFYYGKPLSFEALLLKYAGGEQIGFENPEESDYYTTLGRVNLYDMTAISDDGDDSFRRYFDTLPMAIMEVNGDQVQYVRCNKSYRDFIERLIGVTLTSREISHSDLLTGHGAAFTSALLRCSRDGNRAVIDEPIDDKTTVHIFIRRIAVNPVTGAAAIAAAVLAVVEEKENAGASFASITRALSSDYINLYYVDIETDQFIEYTPDTGREDLLVERRGADFFNASAKDAQLFIYSEDREYFTESFTHENVLRNIDEHGTFTLTYRLLMDDAPIYVSMKAVRMRSDRRHIIIGVSNVDVQMRQKEAMARLQAEQTTYSRVNALTKGFICIYTIDPATGHYVEYSADRDYAGLNLDKAGENFWEQARRDSVRHVHPEDIGKFQTLLTREKVMEEIGKNGLFSMQYRMFLDGEPKYVTAQAALVEEKDGPQLILGVNNVDDLVRREQDYERKLAAARSRANLDTLTGVKNRTAYDSMSRSLARQIEIGQPVRYAIALCRVKDLSRVNETQGHEAGDRLIREACAIVCETFKHSPVFRVAGDQFAVIAQGHDYDCIDALVGTLAQLNRQNAETDGPVILCGMARYDGSGNVTSVFERADAQCR